MMRQRIPLGHKIIESMRPEVLIVVNHEQFGYLSRNASGQYCVPGQAQAAEATEANTANTNADNGNEESLLPAMPLTPDAEESLHAVTAGLPDQLQGALVSRVLSNAPTNSDDIPESILGETAHQFADQLGIDVQALDGHLDSAIDGFGAQAASHLQQTLGVEDPAEFMSYWLARDKTKFMASVRTHLFSRNPKGAYDALVKEYIRHSK